MDSIVLVIFIVLQIAASKAETLHEREWVKRVSKRHWVVWVIHPAVLKGGHDFVIYLVAELPKHF